jgi:hypothetical protein
MKLIHNYSGKSLSELREEYGSGLSGFYNTDWWLEEDWAKEHSEKGEYEIVFHEDWNNSTYQKQLEKLGDKEEFLHPAILAEAILEYYNKTGNKLMENWYSRTNGVGSDGSHVCVGYFGAGGLGVYYWDGDRYGGMGVSSAKKFKTGNLDIEDRISKLENDMDKIRKFLII